MIKNDECSILGEVINFENIYELMNVEEKNTLVILEEKINNFLLGYYKNFERLTIRELEELNNFLNIIIKKFIEEKRTLLVNILLIHFQNIPSSFINVKLKDNIFYIEEIKKFFLSILDLSSYLKKCKNDNSEKINSLITSIINFLNLFLVDTLKLIGSNVYKDFYIRIIIDSRILEIFNNLYFDQELENEKIIHSLLLLTEFKEFDDEICKCDIIKLFINLLSTNIYTNYLIIQIIINVVNRNIKIIKLLIHDEIELINNILEKIYISIKRECYDFTCINLLKLFSYIIEGNCFDKLIFFDEHYYLNNSGIIFFSTLYNIIEHIRSLIKFHNIMNILEEKNELFYDFICILFCVLRNLIELIINPHKKIIFRSINENSDENKKYKVNVESIKLINNILNLSLDFLTCNNLHFSEEKKMLHLLCFDIINGVNSSSLTEIIDCTTLTEKIIKKIQNMKDKNMHNKYLYVKYLESLFYISLNNERVSKETLKENFIINIEENFYKINKDTKHKNLKNLELDNLLKLYYFGIINIFVKNNLTSEIILPFVNYVILEELKRKNFLLQNELYYLVFLQFLNIIIINNLYEFRKFIENDLLEDLLKIFKISSFHLKIMILKILIQWVEKKVILEEIKNYLNKNKMIFKVLLEFWKEIQNMNNGIRNLNLEINELNNIRSIIYYIFKILTNNFTKGLNYFSKNEEFLYYFRCIMIFEEKSILDIYNSIMNQTNTKELVVLENDKLILNGKIEKCKAKIENIEKKFHIIINLKDKKNINNLENFYNYVRGQHE